jgi:hypothetical protein
VPRGSFETSQRSQEVERAERNPGGAFARRRVRSDLGKGCLEGAAPWRALDDDALEDAIGEAAARPRSRGSEPTHDVEEPHPHGCSPIHLFLHLYFCVSVGRMGTT